MSDISLHARIAEYRTRFPARGYNQNLVRGPSELSPIAARFVSKVSIAPLSGAAEGEVARAPRDPGQNKHLWIFGATNAIITLETGVGAQSIGASALKHTNLTGGQDARCGGEAWFRDESSVWINGKSGRYPPREGEMPEIVALLRHAAYSVCDMG
jgi:hypothetical protein